MRHAPEAEQSPYDDGLSIDGIGERLPDALVLELRVAQIEQKVLVRRRSLETPLDDAEPTVLAQTADRFVGHDISVEKIDLAALEREESRRRIGRNLKHQAVEVRQPRLEVVRVPLERDERSGLPFSEFERPASNRLPIGGVRPRIRALVDMLRQNQCAASEPIAEQRQKGANGAFNVIANVCSDSASAEATLFHQRLARGCTFARTSSNVNSTSSAVTGSPSCHRASGFKWKT